MPYRYLEDIAIADAAFEAWGHSIEEMLISACDATINVRVCDLSTIRYRYHRHLQIADAQIDMLLFQLRQELIYYKDAEQLLLRARTVRLEPHGVNWVAYAELAGQFIDPQRHGFIVDNKAITFHQFEVRQINKCWTARIIVDVRKSGTANRFPCFKTKGDNSLCE